MDCDVFDHHFKNIMYNCWASVGHMKKHTQKCSFFFFIWKFELSTHKKSEYLCHPDFLDMNCWTFTVRQVQQPVFFTLQSVHVIICLLQAVALTVGARTGFFQGDVRKLMDDIKELQPTIFPSVPRLLNRFYDKVWLCKQIP